MKYFLSFLLFATTCNSTANSESELSSITTQQDKFFSFSELLSPLIALPETILCNTIQATYPVETPKNAVMVQTDTNVDTQENLFIKKRQAYIKKTLSKEFSISKPLTIALCCSGGGNRALIGTLGFLQGAAKHKILDISTYLAGVSGSTWLIAPFYCLQSKTNAPIAKTLETMQYSLAEMLNQITMLCVSQYCMPPLLPLSLSDDFFLEIAKRYAYRQPISLINIFGPLVANYSMSPLGDNRLNVTWSSLSPFVEQATLPMPICCAVHQDNSEKFSWFEMSPFQTGSIDHGYIPTQYLGSPFINKQLDVEKICPEYPISFYLGMYGSGFAVTIQELYELQQQRCANTGQLAWLFEENPQATSRKSVLLYLEFLRNKITDILQDIVTSRNPLTCAQFPDYSDNNATLSMFDAGIDFNMPLPPFFDRTDRSIDVFIMYDSHPGDQATLAKAHAYSQSETPKEWATVSNAQLNAKSMTIFNDPGSKSYKPSMPTYLYFPTQDIDLKNAPYNTLNFKYSPAEIQKLVAQTERSIGDNIKKIKSVLQQIAKKK